MSADINTLMQQIHDYFLNLFQQHSTSTLGATFLLFEPIGTPMTPDMFKLHPTDATYMPALAVEQFSSLVNGIPDMSADTFQRTSKLVDDFYQVILAGSLPVDSSDALFPAIKAQAAQKFEPTLGSLLESLVQFHPSYATPTDWYDLSVGGNWTAYTFNSKQSTSTGIVVRPPIIHPIRPWNWRVLPSDIDPASPEHLARYIINTEHTTNPGASETVHFSPSLLALAGQEIQPVSPPSTVVSSVNPATVTVNPTTEVATHLSPEALRVPLQAIDRTVLTDAVPVSDHAIASPAGALNEGDIAARPMVRENVPISSIPIREIDSGETPPRIPVVLQPRQVATELTPLIIKYSSEQTVTTDTLSVSFNYCLVNVARPWFSEAFLSLQNWYVTGYQAGAFSSGTADNNAGLFPTLPVACLLIKDLQITAQWTQQDITVLRQSASLGPFSLVGRTFDGTSATLTASGMQAIGWVCQVMPILPPVAAPAPSNQ